MIKIYWPSVWAVVQETVTAVIAVAAGRAR